MKFKLQLLSGFILLSFNIYAQYPNWVSYTNGMQINCLAKEGNFIWAGTTGGLAKIDKTTGATIIYTKQNSGIPSIDISCIVIDSMGNKWIGTNGGGITKFDGINWTLYNTTNSPMTDNRVSALCFDRNGHLWVALHGHLYRVSISTWSWTIFNPPNPGAYDITSLACDTAGNLFVALTGYGLNKFDGTSWTVYSRSNSGIQNDDIFDIAVDGNNIVWAASPVSNGVGGLTSFDGTTFNTYLAYVNIEHLSIDPANNVWFTSFWGLFKYDGTNFNFWNSSNTQINYMAPYDCLLEDQGNIWYGTFPFNGLKKFNGSYHVTDYNTSISGISENGIASIAIDTSNNVWCSLGLSYCSGCFGFTGLEKFDQNQFTNINTFNSFIPTDSITFLTIDSLNNIWMGTDGRGIVKYDGNTWTVFDSLNNQLPSNRLSNNSIAFESNGNVWAAFAPVYDSVGTPSGGGLAKYDGNTWINIIPIYPIPYHRIYAITIDHQNNLWVACYGQILKFDGINWTLFDHLNSPLPSNDLTSIIADLNNDIWVGTIDSGLIKISNSVFTLYKTSNSNLVSNYIGSLAVDINNNLWISLWDLTHSYGLSKFDGSAFTNYGIFNSGLSDIGISRILTKGNEVYLGSTHGLTVFTDSSIITANNNSHAGLHNDFIAQLYPNPVNTTLTITGFSFSENVQVTVFNLIGQKVYEKNIKVKGLGFKTEINISTFKSGIYNVVLNDDERIFRSKIIKV